MSVLFFRSGLQLSISTTLICTICVAVSKKIEKEVDSYEAKYRGRELPGFINYKTFEVMVKEQIKQLEEPALKKLKDIAGKVIVQRVNNYVIIADFLFFWICNVPHFKLK